MLLRSDLGCHTLWFLAYSICWKWVKYSPQLREGDNRLYLLKERVYGHIWKSPWWYILEWPYSFLSFTQINTSCTCNFQTYCLKTINFLLYYLIFVIFSLCFETFHNLVPQELLLIFSVKLLIYYIVIYYSISK